MSHLLYLMFRCDFDVMENLESLEEFGDLNTPQAAFLRACVLICGAASLSWYHGSQLSEN